MSWRIQNLTEAPVQIKATWAPHGRFRAAEQPLDPPLELAAGASAPLELAVACSGRPGEVVENTFLIVRLTWQDQPWRLFARHRIEFGQDAAPQPICEVVRMHPVGFSAEGAS